MRFVFRSVSESSTDSFIQFASSSPVSPLRRRLLVSCRQGSSDDDEDDESSDDDEESDDWDWDEEDETDGVCVVNIDDFQVGVNNFMSRVVPLYKSASESDSLSVENTGTSVLDPRGFIPDPTIAPSRILF
jgi:hypothetical protein